MGSTPQPTASQPQQQVFSPISLTTSSIGLHLLPTEEVLSLCSNVGLYVEANKLPNQQNGSIYLTSHRIIYVDEQDSRNQSGYMNLQDIKITEHFRGFLKSSPKIILALKAENNASQIEGQKQQDGDIGRAQVARLQDEMASLTTNSSPSASQSGSRWLCPVCGFSNTVSTDTPDACQLCGVRRDPTASTSTSNSTSANNNSNRPSPSNDQRAGSNNGTTPAVQSSSPEISCPTCTFLNHPSMSRCEVCDSPLGTEMIPPAASKPASKPGSPIKQVADTRPAVTPPPLPYPSSVKLSFRKGGDKAFYDALTMALRAGAWKQISSASTPSGSGRSHTPISRPASTGVGRASPLGRSAALIDIDGRSTPSSGSASGVPVGIEGLLSSYNTKSASDTSQMSDALKDLKALMAKAKDMVELAEGLEARLRKREAEVKLSGTDDDPQAGEAVEEEEAAATLIRSSLVKLGLPTPAITKEMAKNKEEYHRQLARELGFVLLGKGNRTGLMGQGRVLESGHDLPNAVASSSSAEIKGIAGLDEVWCIWNRLRGIALIPPSDLLSSTKYLSNITIPSIQLRIFSNGLRVLHTPYYNGENFSSRLVRYLSSSEGVSSLQLAQKEEISVLLIQELITCVEMQETSPVVRDEKDGQVRWFSNRFEELAV
ncbi:unnamed protein product [Sympodiomycopsis kandeliae]